MNSGMIFIVKHSPSKDYIARNVSNKIDENDV